jgi:OOP family OmpA-OmpF porin
MLCSISNGFVRRTLLAALTLTSALAIGCSPPPLPPEAPKAPEPVVEKPVDPPVQPVQPVVEAPQPKPEPLKLPAPVMFATGTANLADTSEPALKYVLEYLSKSPDVKAMRIEGHTDSRGMASANQKLSEKRAVAVARWLVDHGADCKRVVPMGYGDTDPVADNGTEEGRAQNRRTVFVDQASGRAGGQSAGDPCSK